MQSSRGQRGPPSSSAPRPASTSAPPTPPSSPTPLGAGTWRLSAAFALLAAACVLVAAVPTPPVPEPHEHSFVTGTSFYTDAEARAAIAGNSPAADVGNHHASHDPLGSSHTIHSSHDNAKLSVEVELEHEAARIRSAFTRLVDPTSPWLNILDLDARERSGGWISRWLGGGEGVLSVKMGDDDAHNISLPHRPAAFPDWLGPSSQLPVEGVLRPFTVLPPPKSKSKSKAEGRGGGPSLGMRRADGDVDDATHQATRHASPSGETAASTGDNDNEDAASNGLGATGSRDDEAPERACVAPAWPPIRPSYPFPPFTIALIERGGCDFATKVLAAQERGAAAVVVGDSVAHAGETDEEGRTRENLITMFSPEDTTGIIIPSVFVSRASYLILRDLLSNHTVKGKPGLKVEIGEASDDGSALGSLLTFALLMPSLFLIATVAAHRVRVARQREANRAPPTVVLSLPERVWAPDIVWEKDDSESDKDERADEDNGSPKRKPKSKSAPLTTESGDGAGEVTEPPQDSGVARVQALAQVHRDSDASAVTTRSTDADDEADTSTPATAQPAVPRRRGKERRKSKRYYSKDECAICMDNFHKGEIVRILPCGHVFHKDECDEWLLKWRKLCPTCRADVTIPTSDLSASTTITPVVDRTATAAPDPGVGVGYGATDDTGAGAEEGLASWPHRAGARLSSLWGSFRAAVARPGGRGDDQERGERAPLVAPAV